MSGSKYDTKEFKKLVGNPKIIFMLGKLKHTKLQMANLSFYFILGGPGVGKVT